MVPLFHRTTTALEYASAPLIRGGLYSVGTIEHARSGISEADLTRAIGGQQTEFGHLAGHRESDRNTGQRNANGVGRSQRQLLTWLVVILGAVAGASMMGCQLGSVPESRIQFLVNTVYVFSTSESVQ